MPAGEFKQHYLFWHRFKWGITDELVAICAAQHLATRTGKKPLEAYVIKDAALDMGTKKIYRIQTPALIRNSVMAVMNWFGAKKNG